MTGKKDLCFFLYDRKVNIQFTIHTVDRQRRVAGKQQKKLQVSNKKHNHTGKRTPIILVF
jgi:hypothetical protein